MHQHELIRRWGDRGESESARPSKELLQPVPFPDQFKEVQQILILMIIIAVLLNHIFTHGVRQRSYLKTNDLTPKNRSANYWNCV